MRRRDRPVIVTSTRAKGICMVICLIKGVFYLIKEARGQGPSKQQQVGHAIASIINELESLDQGNAPAEGPLTENQRQPFVFRQ